MIGRLVSVSIGYGCVSSADHDELPPLALLHDALPVDAPDHDALPGDMGVQVVTRPSLQAGPAC